MPTTLHDLYDQINNKLGNLKIDKDKNQIIFIDLSKMICC